MAFRTIVISNPCKLSYQNGSLIVRGDTPKMIYLNDISVMVIDNTQVTITAYLMAELVKSKIKVIFCDEKRNPIGEISSYYGSHNSSKKVITQSNWDENLKKQLWTNIVVNKIKNQSQLLQKLNKKEYLKLKNYISNIEFFDKSNREGHAAKVYFNSLFVKIFQEMMNAV